MWRDYFPYATIHGADIDIGQATPTGERTLIIAADQGNVADLERLAALGPFDVIIDDGSHYADHQIQTFETLFPALRPGGFYFCEDIHAQLLGFPGARPPDRGAIDYFLNLAFHIQADVGHEYATDATFDRESIRDYWQRAVEFVHFHRHLVALRMRPEFRVHYRSEDWRESSDPQSKKVSQSANPRASTDARGAAGGIRLPELIFSEGFLCPRAVAWRSITPLNPFAERANPTAAEIPLIEEESRG